ncbi:proteasome ATPase [Dermatophilaceae bacterium Soc4.6]
MSDLSQPGDDRSTPVPEVAAAAEPRELERQRDQLRDEVRDLRDTLSSGPSRSRDLESRVSQLQTSLSTLSSQNERLVRTLKEAREQIITLKSEVDRLAQPPSAYALILESYDDATVDILSSGRKMRVAVSPTVDPATLNPGREVMLNEALNVVATCGFERVGEVVTVKDVLDDDRILVVAHGDEERIVRRAESLEVQGETVRVGDALMLDTRSGFVYERIPKAEVQDLVLEEVPDIAYEDIGGLAGQIEQIRDAVELPYLHPDLFKEHQLKPPKGILLYGPPGCGKTLIAKAVAASLARKVAERTGQASEKSYFLNIKGPELLNKYVGETERHIRLIFQRAREKASDGTPVVVFFDEMDSLFRTRGSGVSSDTETTIVPQLLSEIDGVERLENVIVIGASNREDMIDPAILRPGRLDVKIKIERPDAESARDIFTKYLTADLPLHEHDLAENDGSRQGTVEGMIQATVERMYSEIDENRFLEVTYAGGDKEVLYFKDFNSGAMIQNIVDRAKKMAIKDFLTIGQKGIRVEHLLASCVDEFKENEDLPNTTNPDDWARISGKKGERIVYIRTLINTKDGTEPGRSIANVANTGQYL